MLQSFIMQKTGMNSNFDLKNLSYDFVQIKMNKKLQKLPPMVTIINVTVQ